MSPSTLVNAVTRTVTLATGAKAQVELKRLSIRQLYHFAHLLEEDKLPDLVSLCTGQPLEWIDGLADESFAALAREAIEVNFLRASEVAKGDPQLAVRLLPHVRGLQLLAALGTTSSAPSPEPAASACAAASGSASSISPPTASSPSSTPPSDSTPSASSLTS